MRLLYWTDLFWPYIGGVEVLSGQLLPALKARGYDVTVVTSLGHMDLPEHDEYEGIPIFRFPFRRLLRDRDPAKILDLRRSVGLLQPRLQPEITHLTLSGPAGFFYRGGAVAQSGRCVATIHGATGHGDGEASLKAKLLREADWVTANSEATLASARLLVPEIQDRSSVIYNFVQEPALLPTPLPFRHPRLLCIGRLLFEKGIDVALEAAGSLMKHFPALRVTIAGDGPARIELERLSSDLGINHAVDFVGWTSPAAIPALINESTAVIVPSRCEEGFGLVAVEAAMMNRPVVASRVGGLPEVVLDHETGVTIPRNDPTALEAAVRWLLEQPERAIAYGEAARARALRCYGLERYIDEYDSLYRRMRYQSAGQARLTPSRSKRARLRPVSTE